MYGGVISGNEEAREPEELGQRGRVSTETPKAPISLQSPKAAASRPPSKAHGIILLWPSLTRPTRGGDLENGAPLLILP